MTHALSTVQTSRLVQRWAIFALLVFACSSTGPGASVATTPAPAATQPAPAATSAVQSSKASTSPSELSAPHDSAEASAKSADATHTAQDQALADGVKEKFGDNCRLERSCGDLIGIDCNSAVDGPYYYAKRSDLSKVSTCGGACRRGCTDCPPKAWTCATY